MLDRFDTMCKVFDRKCVKCGSTEHIQLDHIVPYSIGGSDDITNIQPLCRRCNIKKQARESVDYRKTFYARYDFSDEFKFFTRIRYLIQLFPVSTCKSTVLDITSGWNLSDDQKNRLMYEVEGL